VIDFLFDYSLFLAKTLTLVAALGALLLVMAHIARRHREPDRDKLEIKNLNLKFTDMSLALKSQILSADEYKEAVKQEKKREKEREQAAARRARLFLLNFDGDIRASAVKHLREEITALLTVAGKEDEVLVRINSPGGLVHTYGLAASQLARIRARGIKLTVAVDKVAASGGYMMACVADRIIAAPFAVVGSIGVLAQVPNFNRLLKKHDVDFEQFTAGEYKRTVTMFGENTESGRAKFRDEIEQTHRIFKDFVTEYRPALDIEAVATGEHWYGVQGLERKLVDELLTSDDYLLERSKDTDIFEVSYKPKKKLSTLLANVTNEAAERLGSFLRGTRD
jgi:serine protease SohB